MLQQFNFQDHTVRVVLDDDNHPMFVAKVAVYPYNAWLDVYEVDLDLLFKD